MAQRIHPKQWKETPSKPVRRIYIPKPGKDEKRPLGIPTMFERGRQALCKLAMEPQWEARFETRSYGFRPGRSCHDAIQAIFDAINFNGLLQLSRWSCIKNLSDNFNIDWAVTWNLFSYHINTKKITTSFKHSILVSFRTKLMMDELPLMNNLVKRHPDIYKQEWKCVMCHQEQESWPHLWRCSHLASRITALIQETKSAYLNLISTTRPVLPSTFDNT